MDNLFCTVCTFIFAPLGFSSASLLGNWPHESALPQVGHDHITTHKFHAVAH